MTKRTTTTFSFSRRLGYTHYDVDVTCDPDAKATYEDRLLELIRSGLTENLIRQENTIKNSRLPDARGICIAEVNFFKS